MENIFSKALAEADSETQAKFLNEFFRLLGVVCRPRLETQLSYIAESLDTTSWEAIKNLNKFCELISEEKGRIEADIRSLRTEIHSLRQERDSFLDIE